VTLIERALARTLCLAYQQRLSSSKTQAACASVDELRAFPRKKIYDYELRFVESIGRVYRFDDYSDRDDDGQGVIAPSDATGTGRWLREGASDAELRSPNIGIRDFAIRLEKWSRQRDGYAKLTRVYEGEYDDEGIAEIFALRPSFVVVPGGSSRDAKSLVPGTYYKETYQFRIWCISQCLRRGPAGLYGSAFPDEFREDPGLNWVVGAAKRALAGSTLGLLGVISTEIRDEEVVAHDLANRVFCNALNVSVATTLHLPDDDLVQLSAVTITSQLPSAAPDAESVDLANYVADGCNVARTGSLVAQIAGGVAYVGGVLVQAIPQTTILPASSDCYRDLLPSGAFVVQSVPTGKDAPALASPAALRVGVTQTDGAGVIGDQFLCSTLFNLVGPDRIPKDN
jgi:hypothetical protein